MFFYKKANVEVLKNDIQQILNGLAASAESDLSVEEEWSAFKATVTNAMSNHVPHKDISGRWNVLWMTAAIKRAIRRKQRLYNKTKISQCPEDWKKYKSLRSAIKNKLSESQQNYIANLLEPSKNENKPSMGKRFWSFIKSKKKDNVGVAPLRQSNEEEVTNESKKKADLLSRQFESVFTHENLTDFHTIPPSAIPNISPLTIDVNGVMKLLQNVNVNRSSGPDQIFCWIRFTAAEELAPILQTIMVHSLRTGTIPEDWKNANIHAIYKKGDKSLASNYRPISLTYVPCKIMEHILFHHIFSHLEKHNIVTDVQHGFRKSHSCATQLITTIEEIARNLDQGSQMDAILLDFSKAFDTVPHQHLLLKLDRYGLRGWHGMAWHGMAWHGSAIESKLWLLMVTNQRPSN